MSVPERVDQIACIRAGREIIVDGVGPNYQPYNDWLDSWVAVTPGVRRALVEFDGLVGSALVMK